MNCHRDEELVDLKLEFSARDVHHLGPNVILRNCHVVLRTNQKALIVSKARFLQCHIEARKPLANFEWYWAIFHGCRFTGTFIGNSFGSWREQGSENGAIEECDFSEAILQGCQFLNCGETELRLPGWPCFSIQNMPHVVKAMQSATWPGNLSAWVEGKNYAPSETSVIVEYGPKIATQFKVTEEELRTALGRFHDIHL
jgi:hypothetical protein